jgi:P-type Cu2+ transporter
MSESRDLSHFVRHIGGGVARIDLAVEDMACAGCMSKIEKGLSTLPSVTRARANLTNRRVAVEWSAGAIDPVRVVERLSELGFRAYPFDPGGAEAAEEQQTKFLLRCLAVAAFAAMNVMLLSVSVWSGNVSDITSEQRDFFHGLSALIALPAAAYAGQPFFRSAVRALMTRNLNMDVPITLGVLLALGMSVLETLHHASHAYFDSAMMLLTFLLAGRALDQNMRRRTRVVAGNLAALKAETAIRLSPGGDLRAVPIAAIRPGDLVLVRPGERIAVDGVVVEGASEVDQSLVTGETMRVPAGSGSPVYAGTMNGYGTLRVRVAAAGEATFLDEVTRLLEKAVEARSRYLRLADRAARLYAPLVHVAALSTLVGWLAVGATWHDATITAIAVLIITCPCALGLAIPAVQVVASGELFRAGVLLNAGDAVERLADIDTVLFDKTGTLTLPEPEVVNAADIPRDVLEIAGHLALASSHPLAGAVARAADAKSPLSAAVEEPGQGVRGVCDGVEVRLGRPTFCGAEHEAEALADGDPDASAIAFVRGRDRYVFAVRQRMRSDAVAVVERSQKLGLAVEILSGDRVAAVEPVARMLDLKHWHAAMTPAMKIARIVQLRANGRGILMVGDGLNDAPSLAAADVSMSPVTAAHVAQTAADAVFLGDRLSPVTEAVAIARKAKRVMRENLCLAVIYNMVAVPIAILGLATPLVAAIAMSGSSILVTLNALRVKRRRRAA